MLMMAYLIYVGCGIYKLLLVPIALSFPWAVLLRRPSHLYWEDSEEGTLAAFCVQDVARENNIGILEQYWKSGQ